MRKENPKDERQRRIAELAYDYDSKPRQRRLDCNLCGGKRFVTLTHRDRYGYAANADGCLRCGLVFLNPFMNAEAYAHFYTEVYRPLVSAYHGRRIDAESIQDDQLSQYNCAYLIQTQTTFNKTIIDSTERFREWTSDNGVVSYEELSRGDENGKEVEAFHFDFYGTVAFCCHSNWIGRL